MKKFLFSICVCVLILGGESRRRRPRPVVASQVSSQAATDANVCVNPNPNGLTVTPAVLPNRRSDPACFFNQGFDQLSRQFPAECSANPCSDNFNIEIVPGGVPTDFISAEDAGVICGGRCITVPKHDAMLIMWNYASGYNREFAPLYQIFKINEDGSETSVNAEDFFACLKCDLAFSVKNRAMMTKKVVRTDAAAAEVDPATKGEGPFKICLKSVDDEGAKEIITDVIMLKPILSANRIESTPHLRCEWDPRGEGKWRWRTIVKDVPDKKQLEEFNEKN